MTNQERKEIAKRYYLSVSRNEVIGARMSLISEGDVILKVYNPTFKTEGVVEISFNTEFDILALCVDGGIYGSSQISKHL